MFKESMEKLIITPDIKIYDLLENYPALENKLMEIAPVFSKLKNPVLRKTVIKITSLKQVALVSNVSLNHLVNELRKEVGQYTETYVEKNESGKQSLNHPEKIIETYDATLDIESGNHPLGKVMVDIQKLGDDECYLLITPFLPAPLIQKVEEKGFKVSTENNKDGSFKNYIWK
jgi:hypothetical protein